MSLSPYPKIAISRLQSQNLPKQKNKDIFGGLPLFPPKVWDMTNHGLNQGWFEERKKEVGSLKKHKS